MMSWPREGSERYRAGADGCVPRGRTSRHADLGEHHQAPGRHRRWMRRARRQGASDEDSLEVGASRAGAVGRTGSARKTDTKRRQREWLTSIALFVSAKIGDNMESEAADDRTSKEIIKADGVCYSDRLSQLLGAASEDPNRPGRRQLGTVDFHQVTFSGDVDFRNCDFNGEANFRDCDFNGEANFCGSTFAGEANFTDIIFRRSACFAEARFGETARFEGARFERQADFHRTAWVGDARFMMIPPAKEGNLAKEVNVEDAVFFRRATFDVYAEYVFAARAQFRSGADIVARSAQIDFHDAAFGDASTLRPPAGEIQSEVTRIPQVVSLRGARVIDLALSGVDLRMCHFRGAHGLASMRLEQVLFAEPPEGWTKARLRWPFRVRWTRRVAIAEEHWWRHEKKFGGWEKPDWSRRRETQPRPPTPHQIAAIYRSLREGRENNKDEPGAADFYYGEMEMRRHSKYISGKASTSKRRYKAPSLKAWTEYDDTRRPPRGENFILWLYWMVSGYGLRASRALLSLAITIVVLGAIPLDLWGFRPDRSYGSALLFSLQSSISLLRTPEAKLTVAGEVIQIILRLAGPLFVGLALLALRGRVKR